MPAEPWIIWLVTAVATVIGIDGGLRFRRGVRRTALRSYRNTDLPAFMRNSSLFIGPIGLLFVPVLLLTLPLILVPSLASTLPRNIALALLLVGGGYVFTLGAIHFAVSSRPPDRLIPLWLREEDGRQGFVRPKPGFYDKLTLLVGLTGVVFGVAFLVGGVILAIAPETFGW